MKTFPSSIPLLLFICLAIGCKKESIDLDSNTHHTIKTLLKAANCSAACGKTAACEGKIIHLKGRLDPSNIYAENKQFYLYDSSDKDYQMEIQVWPTIAPEIFSLLEGKGGRTVLVAGILTGYDAATNLQCKRQFYMTLASASELSID